jgi:CRISPR type III-A-associated protein Csm2
MAPSETYSIKKIVETDDPNTLVAEAKNLAKQLKQDEGTKTQIRKLFGTMRLIERSWPIRLERQEDIEQRDDAYRQLMLFGPRLAYESSRQSSIQSISETIQEGIKYIKKDDRRTMQRLVEFFEAVLAYHTAESQASRGGRR